MSQTSSCAPCCSTPTTTQIPGEAGQGAYTTTTESFEVPVLGGQVTVDFQNTDWMVEGENIFIEGAGTFLVVTIIDAFQATIQYLDIEDNTAAGNTIATGANVGATGKASNGADGINAFTVTSANFDVPAISASVAIEVGDSSWMTVGQNVFVEGAGMFEVTAKTDDTHFTGEYLDYVGNVNSSNTIAAGASVSPGATQPVLLSQVITEFNGDGLAYDITNSYATVTGATVAVPATGLYKIEAIVTVRYDGVTFAASRTLSLRVRNTTQSTTESETTRETGTQTTTTFPDIDYVLPVVSNTLTAADVLEVQVFLDTVESAGSSTVESVSLAITPLNP